MSTLSIEKNSKFGKFDLFRELTDYEDAHFEEFMKIDNNGIDPFSVSLDDAADRVIKKAEQMKMRHKK